MTLVILGLLPLVTVTVNRTAPPRLAGFGLAIPPAVGGFNPGDNREMPRLSNCAKFAQLVLASTESPAKLIYPSPTLNWFNVYVPIKLAPL